MVTPGVLLEVGRRTSGRSVRGCVGAPSSVAAWMLSLAAAATVSALKPNSWNRMRGRGAGAVVVDADDPAGVADDLAPAAGDPGLDADPRLDGRRDDRVAVGLVLLVEPLPARHRDHPGRDVLGGQQRRRPRPRTAPRTRCRSRSRRGCRPRHVLEHVGALGHLGGVGEAVAAARHDRQRLPAQQQTGRAVVVLQDRAPSRPRSRWRPPAGRRPGRGWPAARRRARSAGGSGRPRPAPIESCVQT